MRLLLTGGTGMLGSRFLGLAAGIGYEVFSPRHSEMDITDRDSVREYAAWAHPDVLLHCAAYSKVDQAEKEEGLCRRVNVTGTRNLAEAAPDAYFIYISSDYVFDGEKDGFYETDDERGPLSAYGRSKADGEDAVFSLNPRSCVVRTSWLYGSNGRNFVDTMLQIAQTRSSVRVVEDQVGSPTLTDDLSRLLLQICERQPVGILHATNEGTCSWAQLSGEIFRDAGVACRVDPVASEDFPREAKRPKNSRLSKRSLDDAGFMRLPDWHDALGRYLSELT